MRARNLKPSMFKNELLATSDPIYAWVFQGLWCLADREGRLEDRPRRIHLEVNAGRSYETTESALSWLTENGFIERYIAGEIPCICIPSFHKHQNPHQREQPTVLPPPPGGQDRYRHVAVTESQRLRIFERDGWKCRKCGNEENLHCDHIVPISRGGGSDDDNLQTLCEECNLSKGCSQPKPGKAQPRHEQGTSKADGGPALPPFPLPPSPSPLPDSANQSSSVLEVFQHWKTVWRHPKAKLDKKRRKRIEERLRDFTAAQLCQAISGFRRSPWHCGTDPKGNGTVYDGIDTLLRDTAQVEHGIELSEGRGTAQGGMSDCHDFADAFEVARRTNGR